MRVLHFASTYLPVPGGTTTRIRNLIADPANEHIIYVPRPTPTQLPESIRALPDTETFGHVQVRRVAFQEWPGLCKLPVVGHHIRARAFVHRAADERPDVLHGHNPMACALAAQHYRQRYGTPLVYEVHGIMQDNRNPPPLPRFLVPAALQLSQRAVAVRERRLLGAADRLVVQTDSAKRRLLQLYPLDDKPIDVIPNGVDAARFDPQFWAAHREPLRRERGWHDRVVCLYAGYLDHVNGLQFLLDALPHLSAPARRTLKFAFLGRGPLEPAIRQAAAAAPALLDPVGLVPPDDVPRFYAACDVFLIPRPATLPAETLLPMKLLEAMAMEKTVLVSDVAAMAEVITDGCNGLVFHTGDLGALCRRLEELTQRQVALDALGARARADALRKYTWEKSRRKLRAIYDELARQGGARIATGRR